LDDFSEFTEVNAVGHVFSRLNEMKNAERSVRRARKNNQPRGDGWAASAAASCTNKEQNGEKAKDRPRGGTACPEVKGRFAMLNAK
jgi:hypothetical protein